MDFPSEQAAAYYLGAMIDGEGCVEQPYRKLVGIVNTNSELIDACASACDMLGIAYRIRFKQRTKGLKDFWALYISRRRNLVALAYKVPLASTFKRDRLTEVLNSYKDRRGPRRGSPSREVLFDLYVVQGVSSVGIANELGVAPHTVRCWLQAAGIRCRTLQQAHLPIAKRRALADAIPA